MEEERGSLSGKLLRVATVENMPLSGTVLVENKLTGVGMVFTILDLMEKTLNFSHTLVSSSNALDSAEHGDVDFVPALLPVPREKDETVAYSTPLALEKWVLLMERPQESFIGSGLLAPFTLEVWMMTLTALILMGPIIYLIVYTRNKIKYLSESNLRVIHLRECIWFTYGALMKQGSPLEPMDDTTRLLFATWWIFITVLTSYYTANLTAFLTLSRFSLPLEHPKDLVDKNLPWFGKSGGALEQAINGEEAELAYLRESLASGQGQLIECTDSEILELVMNGHVYLGELRMIQRLVFKSYQDNFDLFSDHVKSCTMVYTVEEFMTRPLAFAFPKNSTLPKIFNPVLNILVEGGVIRHILSADVPESEICPLHLGNSEKHLKLADFTSIYLAVLCGFSIAVVVLLFEKASGQLAKKKRKTRIENSKPKLCYPKDFMKPQKQLSFIDPKMFIIDKSSNSKLRLKQHYTLQFQYLD